MGVKLYVEGPYACFTRPEAKAERVSYEVPTPSACRGILEAVHWKPAISWVVDRIHVLKPVRFESIRRNELAAKGPSERQMRRAEETGEPLFLDINAQKMRQQRASLVLRDVAYVIEAHFFLTDRAGPTDNAAKHLDIFCDRARRGRCHHQPYFGCREFPAYFRLIEENEALPVSELAGDTPRDLGIMLYDIHYDEDMASIFYRPRLEHGIIDVEKARRETSCRHM